MFLQIQMTKVLTPALLSNSIKDIHLSQKAIVIASVSACAVPLL